jgi:hypothetical protein
MPLNVPITEEMVRKLAPDDATWAKANDVVKSDRLKNLSVSADGSWLLADAVGAAREPYAVSADFVDPNNPVLRSNSPSRHVPDQYVLGLLLSYVSKPDAFTTREAPDELIVKREKKVSADDRKKFGPAAPKRASQSKIDKKTATQLEDLELLDRLLVDLVSGGSWFDAERLERMEKLSKQLSDASLPAATMGLRKLMLLGKTKAISEDDRMAQAADLIGQLWGIIRKTREYIHGQTDADYDALVEDYLGRPWQVQELRDKGYSFSNLHVLELAYERTDDDARQQRVEVSNLIDIESGALVQAIAYRPYKGVNQIAEQPSYATPILIPEGALTPGFLNLRVRWDKGTEIAARTLGDSLEKAYAFAQSDFAGTIGGFQEQLTNPYAPREAVVLLKAEVIGRIGDRFTAIQDENETRLEMLDRRRDYSNVANLVRVAGMLGREKPAVLVRLFVSPANTIVGLPLAVLTPKYHLRLGI